MQLCYYINARDFPDHPLMERESLHPSVSDLITLLTEECSDNSKATFNLSLSISGLLVFYIPHGTGCNISNSIGPRPVILNITTGNTIFSG